MGHSPFGVVSAPRWSPSYSSGLGVALFSLSVLPFIKYVFTEMFSHMWMMGSAVAVVGLLWSQLEPAGTGWNRPCLAQGSPWSLLTEATAAACYQNLAIYAQ